MALSPLGKIRIDGEDATPILSRWNWMAITLTTTFVIGILFWATAEPIYHLTELGGLGVPAGDQEAEPLRSLRYICIGPLCPYAIYTVPGLAFALAYHNLCLPFSLASPIRAITRKRLLDAVRDALDGFALRFWPYLSRLYGPRLCDGQSDITHLFSIVWMTIFGGFALTIEADQPGQLGNMEASKNRTFCGMI